MLGQRPIPLILTTLVVGVGFGSSAAPQDQSPEYEVKARYLIYLPDYVRWPGPPPGATRPLVVGILGASNFDVHLREQTKAMSRAMRFQFFRGLVGIEGCDVLFICESEGERLPEILRAVRGKPILTVGDTPDFARRGVMINMVLARGKVGLEVNLSAVRSHGFEVSPTLLRKATLFE